MKSTFCVLHYNEFDTTRVCVDSLLGLRVPDGDRLEIVVVDNCSPNDSMGELKRHYMACPSVHFLSASSNVGFAKGNNIAFSYAKNELDSEVMIFINNDTEICQEDFLEVLGEEHRKGFDVLSPDVYQTVFEFHQSPLCSASEAEQRVEREVAVSEAVCARKGIRLFLTRCKKSAKHAILAIPSFRKYYFKKKKRNVVSSCWENPSEDVVPSGAAVIFGKRYIEKMDYAFNPNTFMYMEEFVLKRTCDALGYTIRYTPSLQVLHHHGRDKIFDSSKDTVERDLTIARWHLDSYEVYKSISASCPVHSKQCRAAAERV